MIDTDRFLGDLATERGRPICRVLSVSTHCYLHGAAANAAGRSVVEALARHGCPAAAVSGTAFSDGPEADPIALLAAEGWAATAIPRDLPAAATWPYSPSRLRLTAGGVEVELLRGPTTRPHEPDDVECTALLATL